MNRLLLFMVLSIGTTLFFYSCIVDDGAVSGQVQIGFIDNDSDNCFQPNVESTLFSLRVNIEGLGDNGNFIGGNQIFQFQNDQEYLFETFDVLVPTFGAYRVSAEIFSSPNSCLECCFDCPTASNDEGDPTMNGAEIFMGGIFSHPIDISFTSCNCC